MKDELPKSQPGQPSPVTPSPQADATKRRFTIQPGTEQPVRPHSNITIVDGKGYTGDPILAHAYQTWGYSVIDGLSGKEYTGRKPAGKE